MQPETNYENWTGYQKLTFRFVLVFVVCVMGSFPLPRRLLPDVGRYTSIIIEPLLTWTAKHVLHLAPPYDVRLHSDSTGMYIATLLAAITATLTTIAWTLADRRRPHYRTLYYWLRTSASYYLALQLLVYGVDKLFKAQFYLPEPNTLYTTLGNTPRDLLYWSTMGISRPYSLIMGGAEVLGAALLLYRRTRTAGAILSVFVLGNVVAVNFAFDISVKLYSCFLLLLACVVAWPYVMATVTKRSSLPWQPAYNENGQRWLYLSIKTLLICLMVTDVLLGFVQAHNYNDDTAPRPYLHGAYHVTLFIRNADTLLPLETDTYRWRRMFIHRRGYLIVQHMNDDMQDYRLTYDTANKYLMIADVRDQPQGLFDYTLPNDSTLTLNGNIGNDSVSIYLHRLDVGGLPVFRDGFHWRSDE